MKLTKKNILAIGGAVMMTASLATFASASTPAFTGTPLDADPASYEVVDVDVSTLDLTQMLEGVPAVDDTALKGTPITDGTIVSVDIPCALSAAEQETGAAAIVAAEVVDMDVSGMDFSEMLEGTPAVDSTAG